jgi:hypothetical protein
MQLNRQVNGLLQRLCQRARRKVFSREPMSSNTTRIRGALATVLLAIGGLSAAPQEQTAKPRAGWPCGARLDPTYFELAEATGGHVVLVPPAELGNSATLLTALDDHRQTLFRLAGDLKTGVHAFRVAVDPSVESLVVSISVQCLQTADVIDPSGVSVGGDNVTDLSNFTGVRMVIVKRPAAGTWTLRVAGNGIGAVVVQARSNLALGQLDFAAAGSSDFGPVPLPGVENIVRFTVIGRTRGLEARLVNAAFRTIAPLTLAAGDTPGTYVSHFIPGAEGFRVAITGTDEADAPFQRVDASLLIPHR